MRRRAQSEERRRRVLKDDLSATEPIGSGRKTSKKSANATEYKATALHDQLRISDFVPRSLWAHLALFVWAASIVGGLLWGHVRLNPVAEIRYTIFDITSNGSLASWFAAFSLLLISGAAIVCYSLRRKKLTDYHNRYRLWLWTAMLAMLASVAATTSWQAVAGEELSRLAPSSMPKDALLWWLVPSVLVLGVMSMRLFLEMRSSRLATFGLLASLASYATVVGLKLWQPSGIRPEIITLVTVGSLLAGHLMLFFSFLWYARYTIADMQGLVARRQAGSAPKKARPQKTDDDQVRDTKTATKRRTDCEPKVPKPHSQRVLEEAELEQERYEQQERRARKVRSRRRKETVEQDELHELPKTPHKKLTKAERKRQRKLKAIQREAA